MSHQRLHQLLKKQKNSNIIVNHTISTKTSLNFSKFLKIYLKFFNLFFYFFFVCIAALKTKSGLSASMYSRIEFKHLPFSYCWSSTYEVPPALNPVKGLSAALLREGIRQLNFKKFKYLHQSKVYNKPSFIVMKSI